ncbi:SDR family oxidoreductase [Vibrio fluminensis]|uniref:SDR family oxidoreductase n=1 Tax=Vibrio fluminensis TaxID=2783614 RepID=UPI0018873468|nr:SDR family oxidoreductase [Vibrio fluminensis]
MKTILITGANRGIGLGFVHHYLAQGATVHATYRNINSAEPLLALAHKHTNLHCHCLDITDYDKFEQLSATIGRLDLLINNAGYYGPKGYGFGNTDINEWRKVFEINAIAPLKLVEALHFNLTQSDSPTIACLSSKVGSMTENTSGGGYIYRSSKAALNSVVKSLSNDLSPQGFTVVALHPGWVQTEMGGPNALIDVATSVNGLTQVIANFTQAQSGQFINFDGSQIPW